MFIWSDCGIIYFKGGVLIDYLSKLEIKVLKKIKKMKYGLSPDCSKKVIGNQHALILNQLQEKGYLDRTFSNDDCVQKTMGLNIDDFSGSWYLTDKACIYLKNMKLEKESAIITHCITYFLGVITTVAGTILSYLLTSKL